jgi:REP element-mobilizing transposase RayT
MGEQLLVIAYHLIWTAYGTWLPNDPRGSGSTKISSRLVAELGELHFGRKTIQPSSRELRDYYKRADGMLQFPTARFDEAARDEIATAFGHVITTRKYTCYACAIMPDHVHIVIRKHRDTAEEMMDALRSASRDRLLGSQFGCYEHPIWSGGLGWKVFLDHPDDVWRTIPYVEKNPQPLELPVQRWPFVKAYDSWPLHAGHNPNSPYARRLRAVGRL